MRPHKLTQAQADALVHFAGVEKRGRMMTRQYDYPPRIDVQVRLQAAGLIDESDHLTAAGHAMLRELGRKP